MVETHLTVLSGTGCAPSFVFRPGKNDDCVKDLDVWNMRAIVEEALCMGG
jgi:hypothetical protein